MTHQELVSVYRQRIQERCALLAPLVKDIQEKARALGLDAPALDAILDIEGAESTRRWLAKPATVPEEAVPRLRALKEALAAEVEARR